MADDLEKCVFPQTLLLSLLLMGSQTLRLATQMLWTENHLAGSLLAYAHLFTALADIEEALEILQPNVPTNGRVLP